MEQENYPLDDAMIGLLDDLGKAEEQLKQEANQRMVAISAQRTGALVLFIRQHKLDGDWKLAANGKELEKAAPQPAPAKE